MAIPSREDHVYDEIHNNYFTLIDAMRFTTEGLEGIVKRSMKDLYEKIYYKCHEMQPCIDNCTAKHGSKFKKWCNTCTKWKEVSLFLVYPGHVNRVEWNLFDSRDWVDCRNSSTVNQIANIFVHKCKQPKKSITDDFANMISLFENCSYFAFRTRPLHRRYDLILLVLLLCYHFIEIPRSTNNGFKSEKGNSTV